MNGTEVIEIPEGELPVNTLIRILGNFRSGYCIGQNMLIHLGPAKKPYYLNLISACREGNKIILTATLEDNLEVVISCNLKTLRIVAQVPSTIANPFNVV
jgi:hypothetical protein